MHSVNFKFQVVRVDDDSTREDGLEIDSKPSVLSEENPEKKHSEELNIEEDKIEITKYAFFNSQKSVILINFYLDQGVC